MTAAAFTESVVEDAALAWPQARGYAVLRCPDIMSGAECSDPIYRDMSRKILVSRELRVNDVERQMEEATA